MTSDKEKKITLLGVKLSKPGNKFIFLGECAACEDCRLRGACLKLEKDRIYEVTEVHDTIHECPVFEDGVKTVEIIEPTFEVTTGATLAIEGATVTVPERDCDLIECTYFRKCHPGQGF